MKYTAFTLIMASAVSAFAPAPSTHTTTQLNLWEQPSGNNDKDMSKALPFVARPKLLDGSLPGDAGFDPFGFGGADMAELTKQREAEIKHGRLAMLAVIGWPAAELYDKPIADGAGLPSLLTSSGESPSLLNGGLEKIYPAYWIQIILVAGIIEIEGMKMKEQKKDEYIPGDCNFDPLKLMPKDKKKMMKMQTKEIKHGRIAMMAVLGFVVQEALYGIPVVQETPIFFQPL